MKPLPFVAFEDETFKVVLDENEEERLSNYEVYKCSVIYNSPKGKYLLEMIVSADLINEPEWYKHVCEEVLYRYNKDNSLG
jgi:hypothetical protein